MDHARHEAARTVLRNQSVRSSASVLSLVAERHAAFELLAIDDEPVSGLPRADAEHAFDFFDHEVFPM